MKGIKRSLAVILVLALMMHFGYTGVRAADTVYSVSMKVTYNQTEARTMLDMINAFRTGSDAWYWNEDNTAKVTCTGLSNLSYSYDLEQVAMQRAAEIALSFDHVRPDGSDCFSCKYNGTSSNGENIAIGYGTTEAVFTGWCEENEPYSGQGHRRNMLGSYTTVGVGHAVVNGVHCWVQEFGYSTSVGTATTALDGQTDVAVDILSTDIKKMTVTPSQTICSAVVGETTGTPTLTIELMLSETWSYVGDIEVSAPYTWKSDNESIVTISGDTMTARTVGNTTISTTVLGQNVTVDFHALETAETSHTYDDGVITTAPTCLDAGVKTYTCTGCGHTYTEEVDALGHDWSGSYVVVTPATCTTDGQERKYCTHGCGWFMPRTIAAGHTPVTDAAVAATCTTTGLTEGSHCAVCGEVIEAQTVIPATGHHFIEVTEPATPDAEGCSYEKCSVCGTVKDTPTVIPMIGTLKLSKVVYTYTGKTCKPTVKVTDKNGGIIPSEHYTVTYQGGLKKVGEYKVTVTFNGQQYSGTLASTFTIVPKTTSITKLTGKKKSIAVTWKKQTAETTGYQIQYSTKSDFKGATTLTVKSAKKIQKTLTKLSAKKKYYVRIRTYKTVQVDGTTKKLYSDWSKAKSVKTK